VRKTEIRVERADTFFGRGRRLAKAADRGAPIPASKVVAFEDVESLLRVLREKPSGHWVIGSSSHWNMGSDRTAHSQSALGAVWSDPSKTALGAVLSDPGKVYRGSRAEWRSIAASQESIRPA